MKPLFAVVALVLSVACADHVANPPIATQQDVTALLRVIKGSRDLNVMMAKQKALFSLSDDAILTADQRKQLHTMWATFLDQDYAFRSFRKRFLPHWQSITEPTARVRTLTLGVAAHVGLVRAALAWLEATKGRDVFRKALNEESATYGVAAGQYDRVEYMTAMPHTVLLLRFGSEKLREDSAKMLADKIPDDQKFVDAVQKTLDAARETEDYYGRRGGALVQDAIETRFLSEIDDAITPLISDIALWMGDTQVRKSKKGMIDQAQLDALLAKMSPGDIVVERRNWYLSNLGLPGFWPHAELYVGTADDMVKAFDADAEVTKAFGKKFTAHLQAKYAQHWKEFTAKAHDGMPHRILEAISEGVLFSSAEEAMLADYIGVVRPKRSALEKAYAIDNAFGHLGKPYDFDFDFQTADTLVCSEVVWASWQLLTNQGKALDLPVTEVMGRVTLPPTDIVQSFDERHGTDKAELEFVGFLDGKESTGKAIEGTLETFRSSWARPKWDISQE
jgi:hypothetical protein